jgi:hypothetical protein
MSRLITALFVAAGLVNLLPLAGVLGAERLESLYGMPFAGDDLLLLMRHRAVLFGLLGAFIIAAGFRKPWRVPAAVAGLISMLAYMLLALPLAAHNAAIQRVFWIDAAAVLLLLTGLVLHLGRR